MEGVQARRFCTSCGAQLDQETGVCPSCGDTGKRTIELSFSPKASALAIGAGSLASLIAAFVPWWSVGSGLAGTSSSIGLPSWLSTVVVLIALAMAGLRFVQVGWQKWLHEASVGVAGLILGMTFAANAVLSGLAGALGGLVFVHAGAGVVLMVVAVVLWVVGLVLEAREA